MLKNLFQRRVPHIVGLYIGATWMMIEIGDWVTGRFQLPPNLTSYIFVGMVTLIPAVAVVAWFHGAPGKDQWTRVEKTVVPLNVVLAIFAVVYFAGPLQEVAATEIKEIVDETGAVQVFEVPKAGFNRKLSVYFLDNRTGEQDLDWLSYGISVLLAHDLNHETPLISAATPFDSDSLKTELRNRGFTDARNIPRPLQLQLARDRLSDALITGYVERRDSLVQVRAWLLDAQTGAELASAVETGDDWMVLVDRLSSQFRGALKLKDQRQGESDPVSENLSGSIVAIKGYIEGLRAAELRNDFPGALAALNGAVADDPSFAEAYSQLATLQYLSGASQDASATIEKALAHDYRLSLASKFQLRTLRYQFEGKSEAALRVLQMWTEVQTQNPEAFRELGRLLMVQGGRQDEAIAAFQKVLDLNPAAYGVYLQQATVEQTRGNFDAAARLASKFLDFRPDDVDARLLLARISVAAGNLDAARDAYQDAEILATGNLAPELGIARLDMRMGHFQRAEQRVNALLDRELTQQQRVEVLNAVFELQYMQGKLNDCLVTLATMDEAAQAFLPPVVRIIQIGSTVASIKMLQGDFDSARAEVARMAEQMQPPFNDYLAFSRLSIEAEADNDEAYFDALADAESFYAASKNEMLAPFVLWGRAYGSRLRGEKQEAFEQVIEALRAYDQSFVSSLSESASSVEIKIEMYRLLVHLGRFDEAEQGLQRIIDSAPALAIARQTKATLAAARGDTSTAEKELKAVLEIWAEADSNYTRFKQAQEQLAAL